MKVAILGAGLSGLTSAYYLQNSHLISKIDIYEKEHQPFGLCKSIKKKGFTYDIGPHILFSRDKQALQEMLGVLDSPNQLRRSNQVLYKGRKVQYPFENDLSKLPLEDLSFCIGAFNSNPYENYEVGNMLQFFLKTFGEGITNCYLRPYNEKIWKFDPTFMDTSMVERIPKPTKEEIRRSAAGETIDGYVHQLYFSYPAKGGIQEVPEGFLARLRPEKCSLLLDQRLEKVTKDKRIFRINSNGKLVNYDKIISTIPIHDFVRIYENTPNDILKKTSDLRYNSIAVLLVHIPYDKCGDNFAFMVPDKTVIFHRVSKMDFLGREYRKKSGASYMVEVTYREGDFISHLTESELEDKVAAGLKVIGFADKEEDCIFVDCVREKYAYVIYDLTHKTNMELIRNFFRGEGVILNGRFGNFEYWNMDKIVRESINVAGKLIQEGLK